MVDLVSVRHLSVHPGGRHFLHLETSTWKKRPQSALQGRLPGQYASRCRFWVDTWKGKFKGK
jgi:hypothetical protein